jgi:hypothetical protein
MIVNQRHVDSTIGKMEGSNFEFHLTGSRFFGGFKPSSDWDYFVQDSNEVRDFLVNIGFDMQEDPIFAYDDITIVSLFTKNDIHVQIVQNAKLKAEAQQLLSEFAKIKAVPKEYRRYFWNFAFAILEANKRRFPPVRIS